MKFTKYRLGELGRIVTGKTPNTSNPALWNGDVQFVTPEELQHGKNILQTERHLTQQGVKSIRGAFIPAESVCVSCIGNIGYVAKTIYPCVTNQQINTIIPSGAHSSDFLYYKLKSIWHYFKLREGNATTIPILSKSDFANIAIHLPDLPTQLRIAGILGSLDEKIELNRKKIAELEALAKTIYDYWFVQFDFPDKNGKPYKSSGGKMVWNEQLKREVPEGWEVGKLLDIATITMGQSPEGSSLNELENGTLFFQGSSDFGEVVPSNRVYTISPTRMANSGDILLSVRAPVGATNIALLPCCIGRGLASLRGKDCSNVFILQTLSLVRSRFAAKNVDGTTFGSLSKDELGGLEILKPPVALVHVFDNLAMPIMEQVLGFVQSIRETSSLRDTLLPLLMNGQVSVGALK